ncbi:amidase [Erythrobacter sp.]|jgi:aspartyl-tRNA(Asn)/glutamyl-tRNA(Gln) amidotransferase subunit A|uniref:amidase n=1 Tax=Erythrobacter sp. TaxID=1042 RepID=UPI002ECBA6FE|nr:amidase [Erythrobacter sp.]
MLDAYNAFLYRDDDATGGEGALAGLSIGVKANIAVEGMPLHAGLGAWKSRVAEEDAEVVRRLRKAGAAIIGILNMEEGALGAKTDNPHFGPTHNPHRHGYSPGGSSGGSGAAVAAGLCDVALGTDTMGSVRIPAAHCGVYGFKPATDRVSQEGLIPADRSLDAIGPLARDLDTLEKVSRVISDFGDGHEQYEGAVLARHGVEVKPQVEKAFERALAGLRGTPAEISLEEPNSRIRFAGFIRVSKALADDLGGVAKSDRLAKLLTYGPGRSIADWAEDQAILDRTAKRVNAILEEHGFLIMPSVPNPPFPHSEPEPAAQADFTCLANIAGCPALSMPMGYTEDGLPLGVQIVGSPGYEAGLFALARYLDNNLRAYRAPESARGA